MLAVSINGAIGQCIAQRLPIALAPKGRINAQIGVVVANVNVGEVQVMNGHVC